MNSSNLNQENILMQGMQLKFEPTFFFIKQIFELSLVRKPRRL